MGEFKYLRDTGRPIPSVIASVRFPETPSQEPALPPVSDGTSNEEEIPMNNQTTQEQPVYEPVKDPNWKDPEEAGTQESTAAIVVKRFMSVKSFVTLALTGVFSYLAITGRINDEQFMSIFTMIISFFFGYSFEKKNNTKE